MDYINFIEKTAKEFEDIFGANIAEYRYALGGMFFGELEGKFAKLVIYQNPHYCIEEKPVLSFGYLDTNDSELANDLLTELKLFTKQKGLSKLVGPINGSTWFDYRLMKPNDNALFFTESKTAEDHIELLESNGFSVLKEYTSNYSENLVFDESFLSFKKAELDHLEWKVVDIDKSILAKELFEIAEFSNDSFQQNFLYSPIQPNDFVKKYEPVMSQIDTQFVKIIRNKENGIEALIFALPDLLSEKKQFIIKTVARNPNCQLKGIGNYLCQLVTKLAAEKQFESSIHAYIASNNTSVNISKGPLSGEVYREYQLYIHNLS